MHTAKQTWFLLKKEILLEWRSKYAFNGILLYLVSTVYVCYISFNQNAGFDKSQGYSVVWNVLFWIIMLFASVNAIAKSFIQENRNRLLYYYSIAGARAVIISKTIYNALLMVLLSLLALLIYQLFFSNKVGDVWFYVLAVMAGSISFSTVLTMISAIAAKAGNNSTLMAVLSFPVMIPVLLIIVKLSKSAMDGIERSLNYSSFGVLAAINAIVVAAALLLFPYLWRD